MDTQEAGPNGALYRLDPDLSLHRLDTGIVVSNGPCWSPDGRTFYFADTWSGEIWAYDCDPASGAISNRRTFTRVDMSGGGAADGSTVDAEGYLWNAQVYDGKLVRHAPDGSVDRVIEMPVKKVTSVMFGGRSWTCCTSRPWPPPLPRFPQDGVARGSSRCTGWACAACPSRASAVEAAGRVLAPPALAWRRVQSPDPPSRLPSSAARQSASGAMPRASSATAAASTRASGGISASTRTSPKRSMASCCRATAAAHDHAQHRDASAAQRLQAEQRVVDGAQAAARGQHHGHAQPRDQVDHHVPVIDRHVQAAGAFHDQRRVGVRRHDGGGVQLGVFQRRGRPGRQRRLQYVGRQVQALGRQLRQPGHRVGVAGFFGHAGLHRLPVIGIPGTRQDGRDQVLPMPVSVPVTKTPARRESVFHMP